MLTSMGDNFTCRGIDTLYYTGGLYTYILHAIVNVQDLRRNAENTLAQRGMQNVPRAILRDRVFT